MKEKTWLTTNRVETLADGIFAIVMTLLVLSMAVPDAPATDARSTLDSFLRDDWHKLLNFIKSFLLLAVFWIIHHRIFATIRRVDEGFLWINITALMFVALVPFSTTLESEYGNIQKAAVIFHLNLFAIGVSYLMLTLYATRNHRLITADVRAEDIARSRRRGLIVPFVALFAIGLTFLTPAWSSLAYLLIPLIKVRV